MRPDDILEWLRQKPFQPFRLVLSNGTSYEVRHPDLVVVGRSSLLILTPAPDLPHPTFERYSNVALMHVNHIDPLGSTAPPISN